MKAEVAHTGGRRIIEVRFLSLVPNNNNNTAMKLTSILQVAFYTFVAIAWTIFPIGTILCSLEQAGFEGWMIPMGIIPILAWWLVYLAVQDLKSDFDNK